MSRSRYSAKQRIMAVKDYLSAILGFYDRSVVSYVLSNRNNNKLVFDTYDLALSKNPNAMPIFHSDRGFQYTNS